MRKTEADVAEDARRAAQEARQGNAGGDPDVAAQNHHSKVVGEAVRRAGDCGLELIRSALIRTGVVQPATLVSGGIAIYRVSDFGRRLLAT